MNAYRAVASRDGRFWLVHIPEIDQYTQARNIPEIEVMARDLVALWLKIPADSFDVQPEIQLPDAVRQHLERARRYADEAARAQSEAASERRAAARTLRAHGLTVRDIGEALGISHQRAQQLISV